MNKSIRKLLLFSLVVLLSSAGWSAEKQPGGKGKLRTFIGLERCFKPKSGTVYEVCADYTINWKIWSLMGEPVGDYNLVWKLTDIKLMDPKRKLISSYTMQKLPVELKKGATAIELYIDGYADVQVNKAQIYHRFNTGTAVRTGKSSFNVPESSNWNRLFIKSGGGPCDTEQSNEIWYLNAKEAKERFAAGIKLDRLQLCKNSGVSELSTLESAIGKLCEKPGADKKYSFCPKSDEKKNPDKPNSKSLSESILDGGSHSQTPVNVSDLLDEQAERPLIQKKLNQEIADFRRNAEPGCQKTLANIDTCYTRSNCQPKAENEIQKCYQKTCGNEPSKKECVKYEDEDLGSRHSDSDSDVRTYKIILSLPKCIEARSNPLFETWKRCTENAKQCRVDEACVNRCNPNNLNSVDECLDKQVRTKGPTYNDAKKLMQKEWNQRAKTGGSLMNSILD